MPSIMMLLSTNANEDGIRLSAAVAEPMTVAENAFVQRRMRHQQSLLISKIDARAG